MRRAPIKWWRSDSMLCYLFYGHASLRIYHHKFSHHQQRAINRATGLAKQRNGMQHQECRIKISWAHLLLIQLVVQLSNYWLTCRGQGQLSTEHTQCSSLPWFTTPHRTQGRLEHCVRSEEHTSELQSRETISYAVFCLKKKKQTNQYNLCEYI